MPKLQNLSVEWVSLVDRAAVRDPSSPTEPQRFYLYKRESGEPTKKGESVPDNTEDLSAALTKAEEERDALKQQVDDLNKRLDKLSKSPDKPEEKIDKSELPEPVRLALEKAERNEQETRERAERAEELAKAERNERITREFIAKAESLKALPFKANEFGPILKRAADSLSGDDFDALNEVLKTANEQLAQSELLKEAGRSGEPPANAGELEEVQRKAEELRKADPKLSSYEAMVRAMDVEAQSRYLAANR